jgi:hypothetical protein
MGKTLTEISPLRVNLTDATSLSKNYTLFVGLSEMGRVFSSVLENAQPDLQLTHATEAKLAAEQLMRYAPVAMLCNAVAILADDDDYRETSAYKKCREWF